MNPVSTSAAIYGRPSPAKRVERGVFWLLRLATYLVLLSAAFIFWDIGEIACRGRPEDRQDPLRRHQGRPPQPSQP